MCSRSTRTEAAGDPRTWRSRIRRLVRGAATALLGLAAGAALPQSLESVLSPGPLTRAHAKWDADCSACHVRFDRAAQDGLCAGCHKPVGEDLRARTGFHGRLERKPCRDCHAEHKGREARIAGFDRSAFDHARTDFALRGAHQRTECTRCHLPSKPWRAAASACASCHAGNDAHRGALGTPCADCHTESAWKPARIDHDRTRFPLAGRHADADCAACHRDQRFRETPQQCHACHKKDDNGPRGHKGMFGEKCDRCHGTAGWKPARFDHDGTRFALRGRHRSAGCAECHVATPQRAKPPADCWSCHRKDDPHQESLGHDCGACHDERDWRGELRFDHGKSRFPLVGRHVTARCERCHPSKVFDTAPRECIGCHRKEDRHQGTLGEDCKACHTEREWRIVAGRFDHDRARFVLRNAHAAPALPCSACHRDLAGFRTTPTPCSGCHARDDRHETQLGTRCESCHDDRGWTVRAFDHARARFPLVGRHLATACRSCHASLRFKDAASDCAACHDKDDRHRLAFGHGCADCHNARAWALGEYDHERSASFKLEGAHRKVACDACHTKPAPAGQRVAPLATACVACHRGRDPHDGNFGTRCESCHQPESWKKVFGRPARTSQRSGEAFASSDHAAGGRARVVAHGNGPRTAQGDPS